MRIILRALVVAVVAAAWNNAALAQTAADTVLLGGKIVTVDDRFTIAEALAVKGERIVAVGSTADIEKLKGPATRVVDLNGRTVIPGLIDNHAHFMRAAEYWHREVRLDGVTSHKEALDLIKEKVSASKPGEWVVVLGGWSEGQRHVGEPPSLPSCPARTSPRRSEPSQTLSSADGAEAMCRVAVPKNCLLARARPRS